MTPDATPAQTRILLAILTAPRSTVRSVAAEAGCAVSTAHAHLKRLRNMGLVTWTDGQQGTLRATAEVVADLRECDPNRTAVRSSRGSLGAPETNVPRTARTAGGLAEPAWRSDTMNRTTTAPELREGGER